MADLETLFRALQQVDARYVVVGGVAAVLHGHARLTQAVELIVDLEPSAAEKVTSVLESLGFQPRERYCAGERFFADRFADPEFRAQWLKDGKPPVLSMWDSDDPRYTVDLLVDPPIDFASLSARSESIGLRTAAVGEILVGEALAEAPLIKAAGIAERSSGVMSAPSGSQ